MPFINSVQKWKLAAPEGKIFYCINKQMAEPFPKGWKNGDKIPANWYELKNVWFLVSASEMGALYILVFDGDKSRVEGLTHKIKGAGIARTMSFTDECELFQAGSIRVNLYNNPKIFDISEETMITDNVNFRGPWGKNTINCFLNK